MKISHHSVTNMAVPIASCARSSSSGELPVVVGMVAGLPGGQLGWAIPQAAEACAEVTSRVGNCGARPRLGRWETLDCSPGGEVPEDLATAAAPALKPPPMRCSLA